MKLGYSITAALMGSVAVVGLVQLAVSLPPIEINEIAKQITVRIDGAAPGTGVIVKKEGNTYTVLTNHHVVGKSGKYTAQTADGKRYPVNAQTIKKLGNVDLAVFQFASSEIYQVAELGDSDQMTEGMAIYTVGWAKPDLVNPERGYVFIPGGISRRVEKAKNGYTLGYTNVVKPGMSGGAVLNEEGHLVGINGLAVADLNTGGTDYFGIPINNYVQLAKGRSMSPVGFAVEPSGIGESVARNPGHNFSLAKTVAGHPEMVHSVAISPDGRTLVSGSYDQTIKIWDINTGKLRRTLQGHTSGVHSVAISPDGRTLLSGSRDTSIKIWDISTGELRRTLEGHTNPLLSIAISPDGQTLVSGSSDKTIKIWDISTGELRRTLQGHTDTVYSLAISPDGQTLVSGGGSDDKTIKIWDISTGELRRTLQGHTDTVYSLDISPDGQTLVSGGGSDDKTIKIWDISTGELRHTLQGHTDTVNFVATSPEGLALISGSDDDTIKIWNISTGELRRTLQGRTNGFGSVTMSADGRILVSGSLDGSIKIWRRLGR